MARALQFLLTTGLAAASALLHAGICACYLRRWDKAAALTVYPFWAWGAVGFAMAFVAWVVGRRRFPLVLAGVWLVTVIVGADETRPLLRGRSNRPAAGPAPTQTDGRRPLRLVTFNCRAGIWHPETAAEVLAWHPDIVLFQEAPVPGELRKLAARLVEGDPDGHWEGGWQCGIVAKGRLSRSLAGFQPHSLLSTVEVMPGRFLDVACVHLQSAATDMRLWLPDTWRRHLRNRLSRRAELQRLLDVQRFIQQQHPAIIGGDFNAPAGDAIFRLLDQRGFRDLFREAGAGWPDTYPNQAPVLRIDHLRGNDRIQPVRAFTVRSQGSDHRMVVCDFLLP